MVVSKFGGDLGFDFKFIIFQLVPLFLTCKLVVPVAHYFFPGKFIKKHLEVQFIIPVFFILAISIVICLVFSAKT